MRSKMIALAREEGRRSLYAYTSGVISTIVDSRYLSDSEKVEKIKQALSYSDEVRNNKTLPYFRVDDMKKMAER